MDKHVSVGKLIVLMLALIVLLYAGGVIKQYLSPVHVDKVIEIADVAATAASSIDRKDNIAARIAFNKTQAEICAADHAKCIGGFVKVADSGNLLLIAECTTACSADEIGAENIAASIGEPSLLGQYEYLLFPGDIGWENSVRQFEQQHSMARSITGRVARCKMPDCSPVVMV